ncbi:MAG: O-antigen ligase family protein [Chloroflexi bacterium]|nr:O-antigen ligase family protein [Chloroflexota bacterium]
MLATKLPFKLTSPQANAISLLLVGAVMAALLVIGIGYRGTPIGLLMFGGLAAISLAVGIFVRPELGAFILVVSVYNNMLSVVIDQGFPGINKPLIALVFLGVMAHLLVSLKFPRFRHIEWLLLAYGGVWLISIFVAQDQEAATKMVTDEFLKDFVIMLCIIYTLESKPTGWKWAVWLVVLSAAVLAALGTYQVLSDNTDQTFFGFSKFLEAQIVQNAADGNRLIGPLSDPNYYGQILVAALPLALYRILDEKKLALKLVATLSALLLVFAVLNTYSRGAFLGMMVVLGLIAIERRVNLWLILLFISATLVMRPFLPAGFSERLETLSLFTNDNASVRSEVSFKGRSSEMQAGLQMFADHPILGVGIANYAVNYQDYASRIGLEHRTEDRQAHSLYLEIAAETGLLGIVTFSALFVSWMVGLHQARRKLKILSDYPHWSTWITSIQMSIAAYLTTSIFLHNDYIRYLWLLIALGIALIHLADNLAKEAQTQPLPVEASI